MHGARSRRVGFPFVAGVLVALLLVACTGGGASHSGSSGNGAEDVKAACAPLADLKQSAQARNGVDVSDPERSQAALAKAVNAYSKALARFARVAPHRLRAPAGVVRAA